MDASRSRFPTSVVPVTVAISAHLFFGKPCQEQTIRSNVFPVGDRLAADGLSRRRGDVTAGGRVRPPLERHWSPLIGWRRAACKRPATQRLYNNTELIQQSKFHAYVHSYGKTIDRRHRSNRIKESVAIVNTRVADPEQIRGRVRRLTSCDLIRFLDALFSHRSDRLSTVDVDSGALPND